jgi:hypothetical protein
MQPGVREVIAYENDVFAWVFLDQIDRVLRYEAYVIDYDDQGNPSTLRFIIEEGVLDNLPEVEFLWAMLQVYSCTHVFAQIAELEATMFYDEEPPRSLLYFYNSLSASQLAQIHRYFTMQEVALKRRKKAQWVRSLRALGYDVIDNLH